MNYLTHVDARNPKKTSNKAEWVDAEGKPFGNRPVYLWGHRLNSFDKLILSFLISNLFESGGTMLYQREHFIQLLIIPQKVRFNPDTIIITI